MKIKIQYIVLLVSCSVFSQKIDTDSLLFEVKNSFQNKDFVKGKQQIDLGLKIAPDYLDYYLYKAMYFKNQKESDSVIKAYNKIIKNDNRYIDAQHGLINYLISEKKFEKAQIALDTALFKNQPSLIFKKQQLAIYRETKQSKLLIDALEQAIVEYPSESTFQEELKALKEGLDYQKIGVIYNNTVFDRKGQGPWHLTSLEYVNHKPKITLIGRLNYADRRSFDQSSVNGWQAEAETYFVNNDKSYSFAGLSLSDDNPPFPNVRFSYSYYRNLGKGWEAELGFRYVNTANLNLYTVIGGISKYYNNYWFNLRSSGLINKGAIYPSFTFTTRYYLPKNHNYNSEYLYGILGYGSSPDDRFLLGSINERIELQSYRFGVGYNTILFKNFWVSLQTMVNNQEYTQNKFQNELNTNFSVHYIF